MRPASFLSLTLAAIAGCSVPSSPSMPCDEGSPTSCPTGQVCYRGFCIPGDAGGLDAGTDSGPPPVTCEPRMPGEMCDEAGMGICTAGQWFDCSDGSEECRPTAMQLPAELCNGLDDTCDGTVDEGFDFDADPMHCGSCSGTCLAGFGCCEGDCVDLERSEEFCGGCGDTACATGSLCCDGTCADVATDEENCGACERACEFGQTCCDGRCVETETDEAFCGENACGSACAASERCCGGVCANPSLPGNPCLAGCTPTCTGATPDCCDGTCVDDQTDPNNCGGCGVTCGDDQFCCGGMCRDEGVAHCGGCDPCDPGELCCDGVCSDPTDEASCGSCTNECAGGQECCAGTTPTCRGLATDNMNCGMCGRVCMGGRTCMAGQCCAANERNCSGTACIDVLTNNNNCGGCGIRCTGLTHCRAGSCVLI